MKKVFKILSLSLVCVFSLITAFGCSCSKTMKISYEVNVSSESESEVKPKIEVYTTVTKKLREPAKTPCYKKMEKGYVKLTYAAEIRECYSSGDCYKKVGKNKYELLTEPTDITRCYDDDNCYKKVEEEYYARIDDSVSGVSECYTAEGEYFERATYDLAEKVEVAKIKSISTYDDKTKYESEKYELPKESHRSLIFEFTIKNYENSTIYIQEFDINDILEDQVKLESTDKVIVNMPYNNLTVIEEDEYYKLSANSSMTITIEIKGLTKDDTKDKSKSINLNMNLVVKK